MLYRLPHYRSWQSLTAQQVALTIGFLTFCLGALDLCRTAIGQTSSDRRDASVVIEGRVEQILEGKSGRIPSDVVQVLIEQATLRRSSDSDAVARYPVPGEYVYIHIASVENESADGSQHVFPEAGQLIRAYLTSAEHGAWQSVSAVWFDLIDSGLDDRASREERGKPTERPTKRGDLVDFGYWGMQGETASVGSRVAVRVMKVHADGPARRAGLEVGDVIVAINGETIDLELLQRPPIGKLQLSVVDVNSGRVAQVEIVPQTSAPDAAVPAETPATPHVTPDSDVVAQRPISLGISAESVTIGVRSALKVTRVVPDSPAAKAGLEPGDVLVKANGTAMTRPEQLVAALRKTGPKLTLTVRDVRTGKDVDVEVQLGGREKDSKVSPAPQPPAISLPPSPSSPSGDPSNSRLGVVTELAFYDNEAAVVITEVESGSPSCQGWLTSGDDYYKSQWDGGLAP